MTDAVRPRLLFVDDDEQVLEGLSGALWRSRRVWDMTFAHGGEAALAALSATAFDAVITDMRMPGVDGETVLHAARARHPGTVRLILSGQTDRAATTRTTAIAHQFLSKPCSPDELRGCLERMLAITRGMAPAMRDVVCGAGPLPITVEARERLLALLAEPAVAPATVLAALDEDLGLMAKLMHVAGAGFYAKRQPVASLAQALDILGTDAVRELVESMEPRAHTAETRRLYAHSVAAGRRFVELSSNAHAFLCAVWYGVGQLALLDRFGAAYVATLDAAAADPARRLDELELERFGMRHQEVGARIVDLWGLGPPTCPSH